MNKKGFTLVELLVVIAIIGILSIIVIPSVVNINKNINEKLYQEKVSSIESAAKIYANNHEEIFNGTTEAVVYVQELVDEGLFTSDVTSSDNACGTQTTLKDYYKPSEATRNNTKGCVIDPRNDVADTAKNMNQFYVILTKEGATVATKYIGSNTTTIAGESGSSKTLVAAVCAKFDKTPGKGYKCNGSNCQVVDCKCTVSGGNITGFTPDGIEACLFSGTSPENFLKYGDSQPNWRVLGVYKIDSNTFAAKMITSDAI